MTLGQRISYLRDRRGLSQATLAKELHIGTSTLGMWETDKRRPNTDALVDIADFFKVTTDYLLGREVKDNLTVAAHLDDDLSDEERAEIEEYIEFKKAQYRKKHEKD